MKTVNGTIFTLTVIICILTYSRVTFQVASAITDTRTHSPKRDFIFACKVYGVIFLFGEFDDLGSISLMGGVGLALILACVILLLKRGKKEED